MAKILDQHKVKLKLPTVGLFERVKTYNNI